MARFIVLRDTFISHIGKLARAGEEVEFDIPVVNGKPMAIADNLERIDEKPKAKGKKDDAADLA